METAPDKRIICEPYAEIRAAARAAMKGRAKPLFFAAVLFALCINLPIVVVEEITGFWNTLERAMTEYAAILTDPATLENLQANAALDYAALDYEALMANPAYAEINDWANSYAGKLNFSFASWLFLLLVPGPLTLGLSTVWLRVIRGKDVFADMTFSGFGNFARAAALNILRMALMFLWSILFLFPGAIAYYRYSLAFFLLADNPQMPPAAALTLSKYYMQGNKGNRFALDLTFLGWLALSAAALFILNSAALALLSGAGYEAALFTRQLISCVLAAFALAPVCAYRGAAAAEYYHRVICRAPDSFKEG